MAKLSDRTTRNTLLAQALADRGLQVASIEVHTPDGRTWNVFADATGGYRLFEVDPQRPEQPEEHDAVNGSTWTTSELLEYLDAAGKVGRHGVI